jgi:L-fuconate dehydratase
MGGTGERHTCSKTVIRRTRLHPAGSATTTPNSSGYAILLLAAKFGVPVCPHAGGVGLCEAVQHLSMFDYVAVSGSLVGRRIEYVDHLHEHLTTPVQLQHGRYLAPLTAGAGTEILEDSLTRFAYPDGAAWCDIDSA